MLPAEGRSRATLVAFPSLVTHFGGFAGWIRFPPPLRKEGRCLSNPRPPLALGPAPHHRLWPSSSSLGNSAAKGPSGPSSLFSASTGAILPNGSHHKEWPHPPRPRQEDLTFHHTFGQGPCSPQELPGRRLPVSYALPSLRPIHMLASHTSSFRQGHFGRLRRYFKQLRGNVSPFYIGSVLDT